MGFSKVIFVIYIANLAVANGNPDQNQRYAVTEEIHEENTPSHSGYQIYEVVDENNSSTSSISNKNDKIKWMLLPDGKGDVGLAILSGLEPKLTNSVENVEFYLYSRQNPTRAEKRSMTPSCLPVFKYFKAARPTKFLIHGFGDSVEDSIMYPILRDAFLTKGDYNIFMVDWKELAATPWYNRAMQNTELVAMHSATLIDHLCKSAGAETSSFHLIGFSLGAHIAGMIGQFVKSGRIKRITALDPAQILFTGVEKNKRLDENDANLVEVVHTSGGYLGFQDALGHRDIFPNGGSWPQPGCFLDYAAVCSHRRAYYYYGEAVKNKKGFRAVPCTNWPDFMAGACKKNIEDSFELANERKTKKYKGKYFLSTNSEAPFGIVEKSARETNSNEYDYFGSWFGDFPNYV